MTCRVPKVACSVSIRLKYFQDVSMRVLTVSRKKNNEIFLSLSWNYEMNAHVRTIYSMVPDVVSVMFLRMRRRANRSSFPKLLVLPNIDKHLAG